MITRITGRLQSLRHDSATLAAGPFEYEVLIPEFTRRQLQSHLNQEVSLHTIQYLDGNPAHGRLTPRLVGFTSEVEREFFELFCSVDGVGVKKALRAMVRPVREVAAAIEGQQADVLSSLPGVGAALADRIVAKLRRTMPKFALMAARDLPEGDEPQPDLISDTFQALRQLGHSETEARRLIESVAGTKRKFKDVGELIAAIYDKNRPS